MTLNEKIQERAKTFCKEFPTLKHENLSVESVVEAAMLIASKMTLEVIIEDRYSKETFKYINHIGRGSTPTD